MGSKLLKAKINNKKIGIITAGVLLVFVISVSSVYAFGLKNYNALMTKGSALLKEDKFDSAIDVYKKAQSTYFGKKHVSEINSDIILAGRLKDSKQNYDQGIKLYNDKKYVEAIDSLKKVVKEDGKRYLDSNSKIEESKKIYTEENIKNAKNEAGNKKYDAAITYLNAVINFDSSNTEAAQLKSEYVSLQQKQKEDEANAIKLKEEEAAKEKAAAAQKSAGSTAGSSTTQSSVSTASAPAVSTAKNTETVTFGGGWFNVNKNDGIIAPGGFGIMMMGFGIPPNGIYYKFIQGSAGSPLNYDITFHLQGRDASYKGVSSYNMQVIPASVSEVPRGANIKIDISVIYKGKTYSDTFYEVLNDRY
jgi:tetratricopeptide (TPR) repeat protein